MKVFRGRVVVEGTAKAEALVSTAGFNTLASYQKSLMFGDQKATCSDQNNPDIFRREMAGKALCLPQTIGSTTGGLVLFSASAMGRQPACMLFADPIDSLAAAGVVLATFWTDNPIPTVDTLGEEFLAAVKSGMTVEVLADGEVRVS